MLPLIILAVCLSTSHPSWAEPARLFRIGVLTAAWGKPPHVQGLLDGLGELGYREDHDFVLGIRFTRGKRQDLERAAFDLVEAQSDLIVTTSIVTTQAVQRATTQIPIVFTGVEDPVGSGLIHSYAQPGGNITGISTLDIILAPKRLEVFQDLIPTLKRVLYVYDPTDVYPTMAEGLLKQAAHRLGIELVVRTVETEADVHTLFSQVDQLEVDGILSATCCVLNIAGSILELHQKIPTMFHTAEFWIEHGALASYGPNTYISGRQSAHIVEKIMKGANPATIPVEANSNIQFIINLKTAQILGIDIPPKVLVRANHVVR
ncbi:MAG: ABC transporter substrate-binding protein [Candidatus Tectomicrobia bacterium]|nr:ABC transporter substrate-binding protein [Candidatus Tectomicrobia bacterium]